MTLTDKSSSRPRGVIGWLVAATSHMEALVDLVRQGRDLAAQARGSLANWRSYIPRLSLVCADVMDLFPALFPGSPISSGKLRAQEQEVRLLGEFVSIMNHAVASINDIYAARKAELCQNTLMVVEQVNALRRMPMLPEEQRAQLEKAVVLIDAIIEAYNESIRTKRRNNKKLRDEGAAKAAAVEAKLQTAQTTIQVLRGKG